MRALDVTVEARRDIRRLLSTSEELFGGVAADRYNRLIDQALLDLRSDPDRAGVRNASPYSSDLKLYHLSSSRNRLPSSDRVKRPRHYMVFSADDEVLTLVRVFDDRMDLPTRLRALSQT